MTHDPVTINVVAEVNNMVQPPTQQTRYEVVSSTTGKVLSEGVGETKDEARSNLRPGMLAAGWTDIEFDALLAQYDASFDAAIKKNQSLLRKE